MEQPPDKPEDYAQLDRVANFVSVNLGRYVLATIEQGMSLVTDEPKLDINDKDLAILNSYDLSRISTETDHESQTANLLLIGPVWNSEVKSVFFSADTASGELTSDPLELLVKLHHRHESRPNRGKRSRLFDVSMTMLESREASLDEYKSVSRLIKIASDLSKDPLSHPHNKTMLGIIMEKYIWRMAHLFPAPETEKNESDAVEELIRAIFETPNSIQESIHPDSATFALRYRGKGGEDRILAVKDDNGDFLLKSFDPKTHTLELNVLGPFADNAVSDEFFETLNQEQLKVASKILRTGTPIRGEELELFIKAIDKAEDKLINQLQPDDFEDAVFDDETHFPG